MEVFRILKDGTASAGRGSAWFEDSNTHKTVKIAIGVGEFDG